MPELPADEWRVEVDLDDEAHGYPLSERLRSHGLDAEARERLGGRVIVTRDGPRLYLYATSAAAAREAERAVSELLEADGLTADVGVTHWDDERDAWVAPDGEVVESNRAEDGTADWFVLVEPHDSASVEPLAERLRAESLPVERRGHYLLIGSDDEQEVQTIADRVRAVAGPDVEVQVRADTGIPAPTFVFFEAHKRDLGL
ncbi:MAG TPA: hypothetical protein VNO82_13685 [Solirubrobacteraceae bacterium]|nr:hypothetical protein [Solirubrobacteraceae bacterium]